MDAFEARAAEAEALVATLKDRIGTLKALAEQKEIAFLTAENKRLAAEVEQAKKDLVAAEIRNGRKQVALPADGAAPPVCAPAPTPAAAPAAAPPAPKPKQEKVAKGDAKGKGGKGGKGWVKGDGKAAPAVNDAIDVTRLNLKVGRVVTATLHPDADGLFVEDMETGEPENRVVISGLNGKIPIEKMQNRLCITMLNLKPVKMRGIVSHAMVMCAVAEDGTTELIDPPEGSVPGDVIHFEGYSSPDKPPDAQLKPKKKVWEQLKPDLHTNAEGVACYKGVPFTVVGKGVCKSQTVKSSPVQ